LSRLTVEFVRNQPAAEQAVEIVERKGTGHPDYICDAVMDRISVGLSREYVKRFGAVLHHNIDKGLLVAGSVEKHFGGGRVLRPMELIIGDRATFRAGRTSVPVADIAGTTVRAWFAENLPHVDVMNDISIRVVLAPGSVELTDIFGRKGKVLGANDTSAAVGYAPFTPTEEAVYSTERLINSPGFKSVYPETGSDVKVMGVRKGGALDITVACPLLARRIGSEKEYFARKSILEKELRSSLADPSFKKVTLNCNTLDRRGAGVSGVYLSLLGTSAEDADSGQVGRGNRVNGVISLSRPMGTEAAAGKNPVSHVGKIYTVLAHKLAERVYAKVEGVKEVYVWLLSQIGSPVDEPKQVYVRVIPKRGCDEGAARRKISRIVSDALKAMGPFTEELARGVHPVC
jgi:S-adenosylmethionine synthetase